MCCGAPERCGHRREAPWPESGQRPPGLHRTKGERRWRGVGGAVVPAIAAAGVALSGCPARWMAASTVRRSVRTSHGLPGGNRRDRCCSSGHAHAHVHGCGRERVPVRWLCASVTHSASTGGPTRRGEDARHSRGSGMAGLWSGAFGGGPACWQERQGYRQRCMTGLGLCPPGTRHAASDGRPREATESGSHGSPGMV